MADRRNTVLWALYVPGLMWSFSLGLLIPILPLFVLSFDVSYFWVGAVLAAQGLGTLLMDIPSGALLRRWGRRRTMLLGAGSTALAVTALFWVDNLYQVFVLHLASGVGIALWNIARHAYITDLTKIERRGRAIAILAGISRIGSFIGPVVGGTVAAIWGMRLPFLLFGLFTLGAVIAAALWVAETEREEREKLQHHNILAILAEHKQILLSAGAGLFFSQMMRRTRHVIIPLLGADILGMGVEEVGVIISLASAIDMLMFFPAGWIMDHWGRKFAYVPCFFIQSFAMVFLPFTSGFWSLLGVSLIIGLGNGLGSGTMMTLGADLAPQNARGEFLGIWRFISDGGFMGSPVLVGGAADVLGLTMAPWVLAGVGVLGGSLLWRFVPETLQVTHYAEAPAGKG